MWSAWLDERAASSVSHEVLSDGERSRAQRYRFVRDRDRFIECRAFTRRVLAAYLGIDPPQVAFTVTAGGRPGLDQQAGLSFNVSHADGRAVVAVAGAGDVGIDIERMRHIPDAVELATEFFSQREVAAIRSCPESSRSRAFLAMWTRKEAVVKAIGTGLSLPLDSFELEPIGAANGSTRVPGPAGGRTYAFSTVERAGDWLVTVALAAERVVVRHVQPVAVSA